ncbi:MAG TPA: hypothetical protein PLW14_08665 [Chlorobiota bacterium]|nr:hypothetical protein [Chlorobiota bacterium]
MSSIVYLTRIHCAVLKVDAGNDVADLQCSVSLVAEFLVFEAVVVHDEVRAGLPFWDLDVVVSVDQGATLDVVKGVLPDVAPVIFYRDDVRLLDVIHRMCRLAAVPHSDVHFGRYYRVREVVRSWAYLT